MGSDAGDLGVDLAAIDDSLGALADFDVSVHRGPDERWRDLERVADA